MQLNRPLRITLITLLTVVGVIALLGVVRCVQFVSIDFNIRNSLYILGLLGGIALLGFVSVTTRRLLKNKPIPKDVYVIALILSVAAAGIVLLFAYGLFKDLTGVHCTGFFGSQSSCILSPLLLLYVFALHPFSLMIVGLVSVYGIHKVNSYRKR